MKPKFLLHTASLYLWDYTLDEKIHLTLDAGLDGVEISNGPDIVHWKPYPETIRRLKCHAVTIHAELYSKQDITLDVWTEAIGRLSFNILNATFHPNELQIKEFAKLANLPFPAGIENMDATHSDWRTAEELKRAIYPGVGFTLDIAHAKENRLSIESFQPLFPPTEIHLSLEGRSEYTSHHIPTFLRPEEFPCLPPGCPLVVLEGAIPPGGTWLEDEVEFVREKLRRYQA